MSEVATPVAATPVTPAPVAETKPTAITTIPTNKSAPKAEAKESVAAAPVEEEFWDVPVDGKTVKMTKAEILKEASLARGSYKRFEEAAQMRREAENVLSRLRDPKEAIKFLNDPKLGLDQKQIRAAFEEWYEETVIKPSELSPEQRELAEAKARLAKFEQDEAERNKQREEEENKQKDSEEAKSLQQEIIGLIEKSGLPKTRFTSARVAYWLRVNESKGLKAPAELIISQVKKETNDVMRSLVEASDGDMLVNLLGESTVKKLRAYDLAKIRERRGMKTPVEQREDDAPKPLEKITVQEWKQRVRDWK